MRYSILIIAILWPSLSFAEQMVCTTSEAVGYSPRNGFEKLDIQAGEKAYIAITDDILAVNMSDTPAALYKQINTYSSETLGTINRKYVKVDKYNAEVVFVDGKECFDRETRMVNRSVTFNDAVYSFMLSCNCN